MDSFSFNLERGSTSKDCVRQSRSPVRFVVFGGDSSSILQTRNEAIVGRASSFADIKVTAHDVHSQGI